MTDDAPRPAWAVRLKAWREAELLSQKELARRLGEAADEGTRKRLPGRESMVRAVRYHEAGKHPPGSVYTELYCRVYGTTAADLFGQEVETVQRREFLGSSASAAAMAIMPPQLVELAAGRRIGTGLVDHLRSRTARLRRLDDYLGGADTYRLYAAEAAATTTLARDAACDEDTRRALLGVLAEQAQIAGWAAFDAGWQAEARKHFTGSLEAAESAGDGPLAANSLAFLAYQKVSAGRPADGEARAILGMAGPGASGVARVLLLDRTAWIYAVNGDDRETERRLAAAREALADAGESPAPDWAYWVDDLELDIMTGRCWTELGRPLRAVPALQNALARYADSHARDKALYLSWLAQALLDAREVEQAVAAATRALTLAQGIASVRPLQRLSSMAAAFARYATLPPVAEFTDRLAAVSRAPATPGTA